MKLDSARVKLALALILFVALPSFAAKRRSVGKPLTTPITASIKGTVLDAVTGGPVAYATVSFANRTVPTSADGTFEMNDVKAFGPGPVTASRSGYDSGTQTISGNGTFTLTFRLQPRATVAVRTTSGSTIQLDDDSVKIGYVGVFSGYVSSTSQSFCSESGGAKTTINISEMKRIVGPAVTVRSAACCAREGADLQRVRLELRNGTTADYIISESCIGYSYDLLGRNHVTGQQVFLKLSETAEVVFP